MTVSPFYKSGTIAITNGSITVTGTGTTWSSSVRAGDELIVTSTGSVFEIATVASDTSLTLTVTYPGTNASGLAYRIRRSFAGAYAAEASRQIQDTLTNGTIAAYAGANPGADKIVYGTGVGTASLTSLTAAARTLLDDTTTVAMLTTLGALPLAGGTMTGGITGLSGINGGPLKSHNAIINGDFDVWQRGTSFTTPVSTAYTVDRFRNIMWTGAVSSITRQSHPLGQTAVPGNPKFFLRQSISAAGATGIGQKIEDVRRFAGKTVTVTFYAKMSTATNASLANLILIQNFGAGGFPSSEVVYALLLGQTIGTSWQKIQAVFTLSQIGGKTLGSNNNDSLELRFNLNASFVGAFDVSHVSIVEGDATNEIDPFEKLSYDETLTLCQRFYEVGTTSARFTASATNQYSDTSTGFKTVKRATPTMVNVTNTSNNTSVNYLSAISIYGFRHEIVSAATGDIYSLNQTWTADAEL